MTWNVWWRFGPWEARQPAIAAELCRVDPDVALLQEVWADDEGNDQAEDLAAALGRHSGHRFVARTTGDDGKPQRFGNAIISRWPIVSSEMIVLPGLDGQPSHRSALTAVIDSPVGPWPFTVTHLAWQYDLGPLRVEQLSEVVELIEATAAGLQSDEQQAGPPILAGDLNAVPDSDEVRRLTGLSTPYRPGLIFTDAWQALSDDPGHTWTRDNPHSADALWPRRRLDYVMVAWPRAKPLGNPLRAELAGVDAAPGADGRPIVPSDHYAVVVELDQRQTLEHD
jgi:endonuclease/exonuclease/phosphatase family metal-dependent hydrolase